MRTALRYSNSTDLKSLLNSPSINKLLSPALVSEVIQEIKLEYRLRVFTPFMTLYAFIWQVLEDDGSCRRAVSKIIVAKLNLGEKICSASTSNYCRARARLPIEFFIKISHKLFNNLSSIQQPSWEWKHGPVKVVDGTGFSVADSKSNLNQYSRQKSRNKKHPDGGFPMGHFLGIFCLATGGLIDLKISNWKGKRTCELSLLRKLWETFNRGDTLLADALFSNYFVFAKAQTLGVFLVAEAARTRMKPYSRKKSHQIIEIKKSKKPKWMSQEEFQSLPDRIRVRAIKISCGPKGFRPKDKWILTTHPEEVKSCEIRDLYYKRWQIELNYRSIKTQLGLGHIPVKTPEMVEKHIWVHMIAYNILRIRMAGAALAGERVPVSLSFRAAQQISVEASNSLFGISTEAIVYSFILQNTVGQGPRRYEPRAIKTRPKSYAYLSEPRKVARLRLHKKYKGKKPIS